MAGKPTFVVLSFAVKGGLFAPGANDIVPSASKAIKRAADRYEGHADAVALRSVAEDESGEVEGAEILALSGRVPDNLLEQIRGG